MLFEILVLTFLVSIVVLALSAAVTLRKIYKLAADSKEVVADEKYYELKYRIQLIASVGSIILFLAAFFGITNYNGLQTYFKENLLDIEQIETNTALLEHKTDSINSLLTAFDYQAFKLESEQLRSQLSLLKVEVKNSESKIEKLKPGLAQQPLLFIVKGIMVSALDEDALEPQLFHYKDLVTVTGEKLPKFAVPPLITVTDDSDASGYITKAGTESFNFHVQGTGDHPIHRINVVLVYYQP